MASPNTLTYLTPFMYAGLTEVAREQVGFVPAVGRNATLDTVAVGQTVNIPIVPQGTSTAITPANYAPDSGGITPTNVTMAIDNAEQYPITWTGEEQQTLAQTGIAGSVYAQQFAQAFRTLSNKVEASIASLHVKATRAAGTYNVQPFSTANDLSDMALAIKILEDNGAPTSDMHCVLSTTAIANIRGKQSVLFKANEAGTDEMLRRGIIGDIMDVKLHASAAVKTSVAAGTMASGTTNATGYAVGSTAITLATAGTGFAIAGDILTFAGDTNQYVVASVVHAGANPTAGDVITLAAPGLRVAIPASATAITTVAATDRNMLFHRNAIMLATRAPYLPEGWTGNVQYIQDPVSKLVFQVAEFEQYRQKRIEVALAWGVGMIRPEYAALVIG